jgi:lipopolysaccharide/colanic/teichoic acid biosynthesis glycosyltransferase
VTADNPSLSTNAPRAAERPSALTSKGKRALDIAGAFVLLLASLPLWLVAGVLIAGTSAGPVLFRQQRVGAGGRVFTLYKFRTMHAGAPEEVHREYVTELITNGGRARADAGAAYKLAHDRRVTGVGRILRRYSLDEVPQLLNVLRGEMSLVGPRPPLEYEVAHYEPWQRLRLEVRPGMTGLWQVSGRNRLTHDRMCQLDVEYIESWSLALDLRIIAKTPWVMFVDAGGAA